MIVATVSLTFPYPELQARLTLNPLLMRNGFAVPRHARAYTRCAAEAVPRLPRTFAAESHMARHISRLTVLQGAIH